MSTSLTLIGNEATETTSYNSIGILKQQVLNGVATDGTFEQLTAAGEHGFLRQYGGQDYEDWTWKDVVDPPAPTALNDDRVDAD